MKTIIVFLSLLFLSISFNLKAQTYGLDNTDPAVFTQFRIPKTDLRSLWLNTNLNFNSDKSIYSSSNSFSEYKNNVYNSSFHYKLAPQYFLLHESEEQYLDFKARIIGAYDHGYNLNESNQSINIDKSKQDNYYLILDISSTLNNYINSGYFFYSLKSSIIVNMKQEETDVISGISSGSYNNEKDQRYTFSLGVGCGKLRNITSVVTAVRFQERMKQLGLINNNLGEDLIEKLAQQFYKRSYYNEVYTRLEKYFWQDVGNVLSEGGVSLQGLNMYADAYLKESVNEVKFLRQEGFIAGIDLDFEYHNFYRNPEIVLENFYVLGNPYVSYSHQLNLNSQIDFNVSLWGGPSITEDSPVKQRYEILTDIGYSYELTDRVVFLAENILRYYIRNQTSQSKYLNESLELSTIYFIEDNLLLNATYRWNYSYSKSSTIKTEGINNSLNLGFTYYFDRGFLY